MIAEVIEKGDATFTIKYKGESGAESMIISMMGMAVEHAAYLTMADGVVSVGGVRVPVLETLAKKWATPEGKK